MAAIEGIEAAIRDLIAEEDKIEADRQRNNENRDLYAQEAMANWARWMFWATVGTAVVTLLSLVLIGFTLRYTRKAAEHTEGMLRQAERATIAAEGAVDATRDIGEKQVRAYLHVKSVEFIVSGDGIGARILIANAGQSPAIGCSARIKIEIDGKTEEILKMPLPNIAANSEALRTIEPFGRKSDPLLFGNRYTAFVEVIGKDVFDAEIGATSMRTAHIMNEPKSGQFYDLMDAEGFYPDAAVKFLVNRGASKKDNHE
ncbi:MAG: hypothetical protein WBG95_11775 [Sulfitobacter sp.]